MDLSWGGGGGALVHGSPPTVLTRTFSPGSFLFFFSLVWSLCLSLSLSIPPLSVFLLRGTSVENFGEQTLGF